MSTPPGCAVLAATTITSTGPTTISGDVSVFPGSSITGFPPGAVTDGALHAADTVAQQAQQAAHAAYTAALARAVTQDLSGQDLGGKTLSPGVYKFTSSAQLTGLLTLRGDSDYVFLIGQ